MTLFNPGLATRRTDPFDSSKRTPLSARPWSSATPGRGQHEFGNAETYALVGNALGQAMVTLCWNRQGECLFAAGPRPQAFESLAMAVPDRAHPIE